jgi:hypothetical protein
MKRALHLFPSDGHNNSGDFIIGPATKWHFEKNIVKEEIEWSNKNVRDYFEDKDADMVNKYDYLLIGGGGLILPDTNPNNISCWQWPVYCDTLRKITVPIYVLSIGYNLFYNQKITMMNQAVPSEIPQRSTIFKNNIETLIEISKHFSLRHNGDCDRLKEIVDPEYHDKIKFEFCPTIEFSKDYKEKHKLSSDTRDIYAFEVKDDRPDRRYHNTSRQIFYDHLKNFILHLLSLNKKVCVLSHDGSTSFKSYLDKVGVNVGFISNAFSTEEKIISNYLKIDKLFCMAGHSQMMGHALGCNVISMISHNKQKYFLEDIGEYIDNKYVDVNNEHVYSKLMGIYEQI